MKQRVFPETIGTTKQTPVSVMRRAFVIWNTLFRRFTALSDTSLKLRHLISHSFQVSLHRQQNVMHLRKIMFQMRHRHLKIDDLLRNVGCSQTKASSLSSRVRRKRPMILSSDNPVRQIPNTSVFAKRFTHQL